MAQLPCEDVQWILVSGDGIELPAGVAPSATLLDGRMAGSTGCNRYSGPYTIEGDRLRLGPAAVTRMACPPPIDALERAFLRALGEGRAVALRGRGALARRRGRERSAPLPPS